MVNFRIISLAALCGAVLAHPGEHHDAAKRRRDLHHNELGIRNAEAALAKCKSSVNGQTMARRAAVRRAAKVAELREKRDIEHSRSSLGLPCRNDQTRFHAGESVNSVRR
jgi:hypothetical protein